MMNHTDPIGDPSMLPPLIRTVLQERRGYHQRFFYTLLVATAVLLLLFVFLVLSLQDEKPALQLVLGLMWLAFPAICGYLTMLHRRRKQALDNCLLRGEFSVVKGVLDGIQRLRWKRVRYIIDGRVVEGELVFPGFTGFQNTRIIDVFTPYKQAVELYLLPNGLIAGAIYPELDAAGTSRPISKADWTLASQQLWGGIKLFAYLGLFVSLIAVAVSWFIEYKLENGWDILGRMLVLFNGANLLLCLVHLLVDWPLTKALTDKYHPSVHVQVYRGVAAEYHLTGTRYGKSVSTTFAGWIRMAGMLHQIHGGDVLDVDFQPFNTLVRLEYLVYKGRLIPLRSKASPIGVEQK